MFKAVIKFKNCSNLQESILCYDVIEILEDLWPEKYMQNEIDKLWSPVKVCIIGEVRQSEILERLYPDNYREYCADILDRLAYNIIMPQIEGTDKVYTLDVDSKRTIEFSWVEDDDRGDE